MDLPEYLESGEVARLFPVIAETGKEQRAASIFLSVLSAVPPFAEAILSQVGQRIGMRTTVNTYTEIAFRNEDKSARRDRPDGLIEILSGARKWSAVLETKIGNSALDGDQIERYIRLAKDNAVDAVITVSNEFAALPTHHPVALPRTLTRKVSLFHFSWMSILTNAVLLLEQKALDDKEQAFLLREFTRFFSHPSAGVGSFTSMPKEWSDAVQSLQAGGNIPKNELGREIVASWHQETRDLSLRMSRIVGCDIQTKLSRVHTKDADARLRDELDFLCSKGVLEAVLHVPNAASDLRLIADLRARALRVSMELDAPKDKRTNKARLNWLLRQLMDAPGEDVSLRVKWASRAADSVYLLEDIREDPERIERVTHKSEVRAFEVTLTSGSAQRFKGRRTFIEEIELLTPRFYELIGQHLRSWKPAPPKPKHSVTEQPLVEDATTISPTAEKRPAATSAEDKPQAGNAHDQLLEIPVFLRRAISDKPMP